MMRAALHDRFGEPADVLHAGNAALPEPAAGEVRIRTVLAPIHNHDLWTVRGQYGYKPALPAVGGSAFTGTGRMVTTGAGALLTQGMGGGEDDALRSPAACCAISIRAYDALASAFKCAGGGV
jgi:D-arabinose 1-dehydrogenase-like Zn-dependent alcohol dehydrogenase